MANKQENEELFELIGKDALYWLAQAKQLKMAADTILPYLKEAFTIPPALPGAQDKRFAFFHSYMLLIGLSFENLIKGILIGRNPTLVSRDKIESGILERKGHGIADGINQLITLNSHEFRPLQRIEEYLFWAGAIPYRYHPASTIIVRRRN